jgi:hypothetical protein
MHQKLLPGVKQRAMTEPPAVSVELEKKINAYYEVYIKVFLKFFTVLYVFS